MRACTPDILGAACKEHTARKAHLSPQTRDDALAVRSQQACMSCLSCCAPDQNGENSRSAAQAVCGESCGLAAVEPHATVSIKMSRERGANGRWAGVRCAVAGAGDWMSQLLFASGIWGSVWCAFEVEVCAPMTLAALVAIYATRRSGTKLEAYGRIAAKVYSVFRLQGFS